MNTRAMGHRFLSRKHQRELEASAVGFNHRDGGLVIIPTWAATVGAMKVNNIPCSISCGRCHRINEVDLDPIIEKFGPDFSLWDRHPACERCHRRYRMTFLYHHGVMRPMVTKDVRMSI